jgi:hypothetical protein
MRLTIIPQDGAVYENGLCYDNLIWSGTPLNVHALQWQNDSGWIEFNNGQENENINELPEWALNAEAAWQVANTPFPPLPPTADENKQTAILFLQETDWTELPSVSNPEISNPYLSNVNEFSQYRNEIRKVAINPIAGDLIWPTIPNENWISF